MRLRPESGVRLSFRLAALGHKLRCRISTTTPLGAASRRDAAKTAFLTAPRPLDRAVGRETHRAKAQVAL
jgi:hypothetical protein